MGTGQRHRYAWIEKLRRPLHETKVLVLAPGGATSKQLGVVEERLGVKLPPSLRELLERWNGARLGDGVEVLAAAAILRQTQAGRPVEGAPLVVARAGETETCLDLDVSDGGEPVVRECAGGETLATYGSFELWLLQKVYEPMRNTPHQAVLHHRLLQAGIAGAARARLEMTLVADGGRQMQEAGQRKEAAAAFTWACELARKLGDRFEEADLGNRLVRLHLERGAVGDALEALRPLVRLGAIYASAAELDEISRGCWARQGYGEPLLEELWAQTAQRDRAVGNPYGAAAAELRHARHRACRGETHELRELCRRYATFTSRDFAAWAKEVRRRFTSPPDDATLFPPSRELRASLGELALNVAIWSDDEPLARQGKVLLELGLGDLGLAPARDAQSLVLLLRAATHFRWHDVVHRHLGGFEQALVSWPTTDPARPRLRALGEAIAARAAGHSAAAAAVAGYLRVAALVEKTGRALEWAVEALVEAAHVGLAMDPSQASRDIVAGWLGQAEALVRERELHVFSGAIESLRHRLAG